jgi:hypothetical protein
MSHHPLDRMMRFASIGRAQDSLNFRRVVKSLIEAARRRDERHRVFSILNAVALIGRQVIKMKKALPPIDAKMRPSGAPRTRCERIAAESATREESGFVHANGWRRLI